MPRIEEKSRRKPDFLGGQGLLMADGQDWIFPKPRVRFAPSDDSTGYTIVLDAGDGYQELINKYREVYDAPSSSIESRLSAEMAIGVFLLRRNYELTTQEMSGILQYALDEDTDPEGYRIRDQVLDLAFGHTPSSKPLAGI
jgi:hypothetical protein